MFLKSLKIALINLVKILMSAKMATLGLIKIKVFWSKNYYNVVISDYDVTKNILSHDSFHIVDVAMRPWINFDKSSTSMREVIISSIL